MTVAKDSKTEVKESLLADVAKATGVSEADVAKVLDHLGLDEKLSEMDSHVAKDRFKQVKAADLKLAVKVGKTVVAV